MTQQLEPETIQQALDRGWVECPRCYRNLPVSKDGQVERCPECGDMAFVYWNLFVQTM